MGLLLYLVVLDGWPKLPIDKQNDRSYMLRFHTVSEWSS